MDEQFAFSFLFETVPLESGQAAEAFFNLWLFYCNSRFFFLFFFLFTAYPTYPSTTLNSAGFFVLVQLHFISVGNIKYCTALVTSYFADKYFTYKNVLL